MKELLLGKVFEEIKELGGKWEITDAIENEITFTLLEEFEAKSYCTVTVMLDTKEVASRAFNENINKILKAQEIIKAAIAEKE